MRRRLNSGCKNFSKSVKCRRVRTATPGKKLFSTYIGLLRITSKAKRHKVPLARLSSLTLILTRGFVWDLAHLKADEDFLANGAFWARVYQRLYSATRVQPTNRASIVPLLDELDKTGRTLAKRIATFLAPWSVTESEKFKFLISLVETGQWVPSHPCFTSLTEQTVFGSTFLSLVVRYGIVEYIEVKVNRICLGYKISTLECGHCFWMPSTLILTAQWDLRMRCLVLISLIAY